MYTNSALILSNFEYVTKLNLPFKENRVWLFINQFEFLTIRIQQKRCVTLRRRMQKKNSCCYKSTHTRNRSHPKTDKLIIINIILRRMQRPGATRLAFTNCSWLVCSLFHVSTSVIWVLTLARTQTSTRFFLQQAATHNITSASCYQLWM